jgi:diguanylate cyclase (GGDEF)-like protein
MVVFYAALGAGGALTSLLVGDRESVWTVSAATLLLGLVFAPMRRALHRIIDRHFFPERYAMRRRLVALAGELPAGNLPRRGRHLVARLSAIFLERSANLLADPEGLTGLLRREGILEQLDRERERALRYGRPLAVAMADIDHFKRVNDRHGHLAGDTLLRCVSQVLAEGLRSTDWIGRYGGEEFLLVLPETDMAGAAGVAEKLRFRVQGLVVPLEDGSPVRVTISIGIATLAGGASARDLIAAADRSLYEAKNGGRNRVCPLVA